MYDVGTIIYIIDAGMGARGCNGSFGIVTNDKSFSGLVSTQDGFNVLAEVILYVTKKPLKEVWRVSHSGNYLVCPSRNPEDIEEWKNSINVIEKITGDKLN